MALPFNTSAMIEGHAEELADLEGQIAQLRALALDMGRAIRAMDDDNQHLELWTQDGDYILDGRWK